MDKSIYWVIELAIRDGERDNFNAVMRDMVEATKANEPNTLNYEWTLSEDGKSCHIYERYVDSEATKVHLESFKKNFAQRFMAVLQPTRLVVYGNPNDEVKKMLTGLGAVFMTPIGGFAR